MLYGAPGLLTGSQAALVGLLLISNILMSRALRATAGTSRVYWMLVAFDVAAIVTAVIVVGVGAPDLYFFCLATVLIASLSRSSAMVAGIAAIVVSAYGGLLSFEAGGDLLRDTELLVRLPFAFCVVVFFGTLVHETRNGRKLTARISEGLATIGWLGFSPQPAPRILYEIARCVQVIVGVERCSLVLTDAESSQSFVAASGDDPDVDILAIDLDAYPELRESLNQGRIVEVHPHEPPELWAEMSHHLPKIGPFQSFLVIPIRSENKVLGAFFLRDRSADRRFGPALRDFARIAAVMTAAFVTERNLIGQLRRRSRLDGLTGLINFDTFIEEAGPMLGAKDDRTPMSLAMIDLDNLKQVNDRAGHSAGNRLLVAVADALRRAFPDDLVCRYGGDEFLVLARASGDRARERLDQLLAAWKEPNRSGQVSPRASIGFATLHTDGENLESLIEVADRGMYLAKGEGGNRVRRVDLAADDDTRNHELLRAVILTARRQLPHAFADLQPLLEDFAGLRGQRIDSPIVRQILAVLLGAVESKDHYTEKHSKKVAARARALAIHLGCPKEEVEAVEITGLIHDFGKIDISDHILLKKGKLTSTERDQIEHHSEIGAHILEQVPCLAPAVPLILHHHERWDGTGYPHGLKGTEIPFGARIVAVCDVYDALTSDRPYRPAFSAEAAQQSSVTSAATASTAGLSTLSWI